MGTYKQRESLRWILIIGGNTMTFNLNDLPPQLAFLNPWIKRKTIDLANSNPDASVDQTLVFEKASVEAEKWFESASQEEKDDILKRYPEDLDVKD